MTLLRDDPWRDPTYIEGIDPTTGEDLASLPNETSAPAPRMRRSDLRAAAHRAREPLATIAGGLLYPGHVHSIAGDPESGKTVLGAHLVLEQVRAGRRALWIDEEMGEDQVADLLVAFGATDDELDAVDHYAFAGLRPTPRDAEALNALMTLLQPALVVVDSSGASLAAADLDENSNRDASAFYLHLLLPMRKHGAAVVVLDHQLKAGAKGSRYAVGAGAKLRLVDVAWALTTLSAFDRKRSGRVRLECTKDRRGHIGRGTRLEYVVHTGDNTLRLAQDAATPDIDDAPVGLKPAELKLLEALESIATETPRTRHELVSRVVEVHGHGLRRETVSRALNRLLELGVADKLDHGNGVEAQWMRLPGEPQDNGSDGAE